MEVHLGGHFDPLAVFAIEIGELNGTTAALCFTVAHFELSSTTIGEGTS